MSVFLNKKFFSISSDSNTPTSMILPSLGQRFIISDILVCNTNGTDATASVFLREQDANNSSLVRNDISIVKNVLVPANTSIELIDGQYPMYWEQGEPYYDHLMGYASTSGVDIVLGYYKE